MPVRRADLAVLLPLAVAAVLGNHLRIHFLFGMDFLLGSIAVLMAIRLYGWKIGAALGALAGAYTWLIWGHPYDFILLSAEALVVALALRARPMQNLVVLDGLYWVFIGLPLVWFAYGFLMDLDTQTVWVVILKDTINGIFNALVASALLRAFPFARWTRGLHLDPIYSMGRTVLNGFMLFLVVPILALTYLSGERELAQIDRALTRQTMIQAEAVRQFGLQGLPWFDESRAFLLGADGSVVDQAGAVGPGARPLLTADSARVRIISDHLVHVIPGEGSPLIAWQNSVYVCRAPLAESPWTLQIEVPVVPYRTQLYDAYSRYLGFALFLTTLAFAILSWMSRWLTTPLAALAEATTGLPERLKRRQQMRWPSSAITEVNTLVQNFQQVADTIQAQMIRLEREATQQRTLLATALEATDTAIIITDHQQRIVYVNQKFTQLYGYELAEVVGQTPWQLQGPSLDRKVLSQIRTALAHDESIVVEVIVYRKDGAPVESELSIAPIHTAEGELTHFVGLQRDISQRKAVERMKSEFVATVSHELRTPVTALRAAISMIGRAMPKDVDPRVPPLLELARNNADRLTMLVNDTLDIERLESGRVEMKIEPCDVEKVVDDAVSGIRSLADQVNIRIRTDLQPLRVLADEYRLGQVMTNLLSNAIKFSPEGSEVVIASEARGETVVISVRDQGRGIPADKLDQIFERFRQVDAADTRQKGGTGLGLAIVKAILERLNGAIWVESEVGKGSCFTFRLPAA